MMNAFLIPAPEMMKITGRAVLVMAAVLAVATAAHCLGF